MTTHNRLPVELSKVTEDVIRQVAEQFHLSPSEVVRRAVANQLVRHKVPDMRPPRDVLLDFSWESLRYIRRAAETVGLSPEQLVESAVESYMEEKRLSSVKWAFRQAGSGSFTECDSAEEALSSAIILVRAGSVTGAHVLQKVGDGNWEVDLYIQDCRKADHMVDHARDTP